MCIDVERYPRTMVAKPMSSRSFVEKERLKKEVPGEGPAKHVPIEAVEDDKGKMAMVKQERAYRIEIEKIKGAKTEINRNELEKGYMYGRTVVPISATDETITVLETESSYEILGFVPAQGV